MNEIWINGEFITSFGKSNKKTEVTKQELDNVRQQLQQAIDKLQNLDHYVKNETLTID